MNVAENVTELVGNTPLVRIRNLTSSSELFGKCEFMNPTSSVKDRIAVSMIKEAIKSGKIDKESVIIEATSGNTGIALASAVAGLGLKLILTMPESMSVERRKLMSALGADIVLTSASKGMSGAVKKAEELAQKLQNAVLLRQFENPANPKIHSETTAEEIWKDTDGKVDILVAAVGTGGTITGIGEKLKSYNPSIQIIAVEPVDSPVLSGGKPGAHKIQGIGAGFVPDVLNTKIYDEVIQVSNDDAMATARRIAKEQVLLVGISSGANLYASSIVGNREENKGKVIVTILCDTGERYLSTELFSQPEQTDLELWGL
ncbi:cysteine synthase A [Hydrogenimonas thermophila]|uniref:cysteine synthase A n=1 Tax=Hydrogenimonas thermophila TaxID=223786 RepID=UPI002936E215|nr:cysteine synthase A [Hydrogenimonas thermophila]WOE71132.1 cysteine synthase A [Hydrogenimonas thermophila]WOE73650.1 cysteine synthase A [Hydrogenimonas thermophila]